MLNDAVGFEKIFIATGYTDLRRGIDDLASTIKFQFDLDPFQKHILFLFCGKRTDRIKGLVWEGDGFLLLYKRLNIGGSSCYAYSGMNLSADVLKHQPMVEKYARENGISEYVNVLLAIIQVESGGTATDVMQSSESLGLPPNSLSTEKSIKQGCKYFASLLSSCKAKGMNDINVVIQSYNYGGGYADYVAKNGKKHSFNLAENFAKNKSGGIKVTYTNPIAVSKNGGWRYNYGNMFYVELVNQYLTVKQFSNETVQAVMNEALKYQGWKYVYGGSNPNTSFDCSGLTQWCYGKAGISLPRTAQAQYDATQHIPLSQAQAGDLVFFHSTYNTSDYVTHVGIYAGNNQMYHAGNPIGYTDLTSAYWQQHIICAGRIKQ